MDMKRENVQIKLNDETIIIQKNWRFLLWSFVTWYSKSCSRTANGCRSIILSNSSWSLSNSQSLIVKQNALDLKILFLFPSSLTLLQEVDEEFQ
jgi:hypothetical protein